MIKYLVWFEIFSELLVNLSAFWFSLLLIEQQIINRFDFFLLIARVIAGIISLIIAKYLREEVKINERFFNYHQ